MLLAQLTTGMARSLGLIEAFHEVIFLPFPFITVLKSRLFAFTKLSGSFNPSLSFDGLSSSDQLKKFFVFDVIVPSIVVSFSKDNPMPFIFLPNSAPAFALSSQSPLFLFNCGSISEMMLLPLDVHCLEARYVFDCEIMCESVP